MKEDKKIEMKLVRADQRSDLFTSIKNLYEEVNPEHLGGILSNLHNTEKINLVSTRNVDSVFNLTSNDFWMIVHPLNYSIPNLKSGYETVQRLVEALVSKAGNDLFAYKPYEFFIRWCNLNPSEAKRIISTAIKHNPESLRIAVFAIHGLGDFRNVVDFLKQKEPNLREIGFRALGFWENISDMNAKIGLEYCLTAIKDGEEKIVRETAIEAAFRIWNKQEKTNKPLQNEFIDYLLQGSTEDDLVLLCALLSYCPNASSTQIIKKILQASKLISTNFESAILWIEKALTRRDDRWSFPEIVAFFETHIPKLEKPATYNKFHNFCTWAMRDTDCSSFLFSRWLYEGDSKLCELLTEMVELEFENNPVITLQKKDLPKAAKDQIFMANKCIGFLWFYPITAASILLSLVKYGNNNVRKHSEELLWYPLLLSYSGELKNYLEEQKKSRSKEIKAAVSNLLDRHAEYLKGLKHVQEIKELHPSIMSRRAVALKDFQRNNKIQKQTREQSVIASAFSHDSTILYGKKLFTMVSDAQGKKHPSIYPFRELTCSIEFPKLSVIDPVGLNRLLVVNRAEKRLN